MTKSIDHALVTGASTGIGRAIAIELAKDGAFIYLTSRNTEKLQQTKKLIEAAGGQAQVITSDLSNLDDINNLISQIKSNTSTLDILVNVAGIWHGEDIVYAKTDYQSFQQQLILDTYMVGTVAPFPPHPRSTSHHVLPCPHPQHLRHLQQCPRLASLLRLQTRPRRPHRRLSQ